MPDPLVQRLPTAQDSFSRKWSPVQGILEQAGFGPDAFGPVMDIDLDRVRRGQLPLSTRETLLALSAAKSRQAVTKPPDQSLIGRAGGDIRAILTGIPRLPGALISEASQIKNSPGAIQQAIQDRSLKELANAPGVRMLPGAFLASEGLSGAAQHPVFALMDLLPYASKAAEALPAVRAAEEAGTTVSPLRTAYREYAQPVVNAASERVIGQTPRELFNRLGIGGDVRDVSAKVAVAQRQAAAEALSARQRILDAREEFGVPKDRVVPLSKIAKIGDPEQLAQLPVNERGLIDRWRSIADEFASRGIDTEGMFSLGDEIFPKAQRKVTVLGRSSSVPKVQERLSSKKYTDALTELEDRAVAAGVRLTAAEDALAQFDPDKLRVLADKLEEHIADPGAEFGGLTGAAKAKAEVARRTIWTNKNAPVARAVRAMTAAEDFTPRGLKTAAKALRKGADDAGRMAAEVPWSRLDRVATAYREAADLLDHQAERLKQVKALPRYQKSLGQLTDTIASRKADIEAMHDALAKKLEETPPARFYPLIEQRVNEAVKVLAQERNPQLVGQALQDVMGNVENRLYDLVPNVTQKDLRHTWNEVAGTWTDMKNAGYDPVFLHAVEPSQVRQIEMPRIYPEGASTPTQVRARTKDAKAYIDDFEIALSHQAVEWLRRDMTEGVIGWAGNQYTRTLTDLQNEYLQLAQSHIDKGLVPASVDLRGYVEHLIRNDGWTEWKPNEIIHWRQTHLSQLGTGGEQRMAPSWLKKAIVDQNPVFRTGFKGVLDRATGFFRMAILPLSPRWHVYNVLGGYIMLSVKTEPTTLMRYFTEARRMVSDGMLDPEIARGAGMVELGDQRWNYMMGQTMGRFFQEGIGEKLGGVARSARKVTDASFAMNEYVDSLYRSVAYLYGKDKAVLKGLGPEEARLAGVELANRVLQDWDRMTPWERQVLRTIFPFYGWMSHILKFTVSLPIDHPLRMSIISNFARNEIEDWGSGVPERFYSMMVLGKPDEFGNVKAVNFRGSNPFSDVANYMTLAGFANQLNPAIGGVLEAMGINSATGHADLYPNLTYDRVTGRVVPKGRNVVETVGFNLFPQLEWLTSSLGMSSDDLRALKLNNPEAYKQRMSSALGLPPMPREVNLNREAALAELARDRAAQEAFRNALKTGDYTDAMRYPSVRPILSLIQSIPSDKMAPFQMPERMRATDGGS